MLKILLITSIILCIGAIVFLIYTIRPKSRLHNITLENCSKKHHILTLIVITVTVLCSVLPMGLTPIWNGEIPGHRNQYELMAEAILDGHLYLDLDVDPKLAAMENPYDIEAREELGVKYNWDHVFYNGKYYSYFGVVPVFLVFLPYRIITGTALTTYHATQIFTAGFIIGMFMLFRKLAKIFFNNLPLSIYLFSSTAFSVISVWYAISYPALYCTAITAALCMEIFSLYFFVKAVYDNPSNNTKPVLYACLGSLFGALAFGCRPSIALANILAIPLLVTFLSKRKFSLKVLGQIVIVLIPYAVVATLLMLYNYARFSDPFEFGLSYQLTFVDQSNYSNILTNWDLKNLIKALYIYQFRYSFSPGAVGCFFSFPILLYIFFGLENTQSRALVKKKKIRLLLFTVLLLIPIIVNIDILWSPEIHTRYSMDIIWLFSLVAFILIGLYYQVKENKSVFSSFICFLALISLTSAVINVLYPNGSNFTDYYGINLQTIYNIIFRNQIL